MLKNSAVCYIWTRRWFEIKSQEVPAVCPNVTNSRAEPQRLHRWKSMLIHQGWFTALYTQHLLDSQSFEFEICILQALNMPLIRCTNVFPREAILSHYFPLREDSPRVLAWELTTWVRQPRSGSCHYPTAATKCNKQPS